MKYKKGDIVLVAYEWSKPYKVTGIISEVDTFKDGTEHLMLIEHYPLDRFFSGGETLITDETVIEKCYGNDLKLLEDIKEWRRVYLEDVGRRFDSYISEDFFKVRKEQIRKERLH